MAAEPEPAPPAQGYGHLRAAHADRERAIDVLKAAFAEGRLDMDEYTDRVGRAQTSRTYGDLAALTADLPVGPMGTLPAAAAGMPPPGYELVPLRTPDPPLPRSRQQGTSAAAVFSFLAGLASLVFVPLGFPAAPAAVLLGLIGLSATGRHRKHGRGLAVLGIVLALIALWRLHLGGY